MELAVTQIKKQFDVLANERMNKNILFQKNTMEEIFLKFLKIIQKENIFNVIGIRKFLFLLYIDMIDLDMLRDEILRLEFKELRKDLNVDETMAIVIPRYGFEFETILRKVNHGVRVNVANRYKQLSNKNLLRNYISDGDYIILAQNGLLDPFRLKAFNNAMDIVKRLTEDKSIKLKELVHYDSIRKGIHESTLKRQYYTWKETIENLDRLKTLYLT